MISAEKVPGSFDFCHPRGVDFASEAPRLKVMTQVATNEESEIAVFFLQLTCITMSDA